MSVDPNRADPPPPHVRVFRHVATSECLWCGKPTTWSLIRPWSDTDATASWACDEHLAQACRDLIEKRND
jgi:hypothetical protein